MSDGGDSGEPPSTSPLRAALSAVSGPSRTIPSGEDFHFFHNFPEFRDPIRKIAAASESALASISAAAMISPDAEDDDIAYDALVDANDALLERLDAAADDTATDGFRVVVGKRNKKAAGVPVPAATVAKGTTVLFNAPMAVKPQVEYNILVNNEESELFRHAWLERSEDGEPIHPLEKISVSDFVDKNVGSIQPVKPPALESTPFTLVENLQDLKSLAAKLRAVDEFAVDLEHNHYRSFQGLTCLIQISTRSEDFVIDALKIRVHIGPYLREVFKDPTKRKVMHGAERDIIWLQRDFGIYVCNLFDTGQASRVLKLEHNSLKYLLERFCGVIVDKKWQSADWRVRPLSEEMLSYAREDTHYLLYVYDLMRQELFSKSGSSEADLLEVYKLSYDLCKELYVKAVIKDDSYLYVYGLQDADLNAQQLAVIKGLFDWRDKTARSEDESTGYILTNKLLIQLGMQMPDTIRKLRQFIKTSMPKQAYIGRSYVVGSVLDVIMSSMLKAAEFEAALISLKDGSVGRVAKENSMACEEPKVGKTAVAPAEIANAVPAPLKENVSVATVQLQKNPSRAFGALFGNKTTKKKLDSQDKQEAKLEQIRASVQFPSHSFSGATAEPTKAVLEPPVDVPISTPSLSNSKLDDIIVFKEDDRDSEDDENCEETKDGNLGKEPMSLSELNSCFQHCFEERNRFKKLIEDKKRGLVGVQVTPFDYEAARKDVVFGDKSKPYGKFEKNPRRDSNVSKKSDRASKNDDNDDEAAEFSQGRRRKAFPASGNRSASFR